MRRFTFAGRRLLLREGVIALFGVVDHVHHIVAVVDGDNELAQEGEPDQSGDIHSCTPRDARHVEGVHPIDYLAYVGKTDIDRKSTRLNSSHLGISYAV